VHIIKSEGVFKLCTQLPKWGLLSILHLPLALTPYVVDPDLLFKT